MNQTTEEQTNTLSNVAVGIAVIIVLLALILFVRKRRKKQPNVIVTHNCN